MMFKCAPGRAFASTIFLATAVACVRPAPALRETRFGDAQRERERLRDADRSYANAAADRPIADALIDVMTEDVVLLTPREPLIHGKPAAREAIEKGIVERDGRIWWQPVRAEASADGTLGYSFGYTSARAGAAATEPALGKYLALWRRQRDGSWKIAVYVRNPRPAGDASDAPPAGFETLIPAPESLTNVDVAAERAAVMAADRAFSDSGARDLGHAFASFAATDGAMLGSGAEMVWGRDEIAGVFKEWPANRRLVWHPVQAGVASSGDLAFTVGEAETLALDQPGTPAIAKSKYLTIWRKQADGTWKYLVDAGNARP